VTRAPARPGAKGPGPLGAPLDEGECERQAIQPPQRRLFSWEAQGSALACANPDLCDFSKRRIFTLHIEVRIATHGSGIKSVRSSISTSGATVMHRQRLAGLAGLDLGAAGHRRAAWPDRWRTAFRRIADSIPTMADSCSRRHNHWVMRLGLRQWPWFGRTAQGRPGSPQGGPARAAACPHS
jgi:hypothetical protein